MSTPPSTLYPFSIINMNFYKHYSFDLWLTLIKSNPSFKKERANYFYKNLNTKKKSLEQVIAIFRHIDVMCNAINEKTGKNIDADEMYLMVISTINEFEISFSDIDLNLLQTEMEVLFFNYIPTFYSSDTFSSLDQLKQRSGSSFNISSNTGFISGRTLRKLLQSLGLDPFFEFQLYSDEVGVSKPHSNFFEMIVDNTKKISGNRDISLNEIIHVGDNPVADIKGACSAGLKCCQINSNSTTILTLLN